MQILLDWRKLITKIIFEFITVFDKKSNVLFNYRILEVSFLQ